MGLKEYAVRRAGETIITFFILMIVGFFLFRIMPGDPTAILLLNPHIPPETRILLRKQLGLDQPLYIQFFYFIKNFFMGEFGYSFHNGRPVVEIIFGYRLWNTLILVGSSVVLAILIGVLTGAIAALRRGSRVDLGMLTAFLVFYSMPVFWLGMILLMLFGVYMRIFPLGGTISVRAHENLLDYVSDYLSHMVLPLTSLTLIQIGYNFLMVRNTLMDVLTEDYVLVARAKGLPEKMVLYKHALRNALLPLITIVTLQLAGIFTGAVLTETVFSWEGLGRLLYEAVNERDYPVLQGLFALIVVAFLIANYVSDILYAFLDPRVRYK